MTRKLVAVHCMSEQEHQTARQLVLHAEDGDAFMLGELDDAGIDTLRGHGLIVEELGDAPERVATGPKAFSFSELEVLSEPPDGGAASGAQPASQEYVITLAGPLLPHWTGELLRLGVQVSRRVDRFSFLASGPPGLTAQLYARPFVRQVEVRFLPSEQAPAEGPLPGVPLPFLGGEEEETAPASQQEQTFDVLLRAEQSTAEFEKWVREQGFELIASSNGKLRLRLCLQRLSALRRHPLVDTVEEYLPPVLFNDVARVLLGIDPPLPPSGQPVLPWTGQGQLIAVADSGIETSHPDLAERLHKVFALGRKDDASDPNGHGTHVAGSIVGTGAASTGRIRGVAPEARLVFQSLLDDKGGLGGLPLRLEDLFEQTYLEGARIHNDSWGVNAMARYTLSSREVDAYVSRRRDMLVVLAAGNEGTAANNIHSQSGVVDLQSVGAPASCKNGLVVGASRNQRTEGGRSQKTYQDFWEERFLVPPIAAERISGDPECLAAFSSRGFCQGRRIKPDLVAPGTDIVSTRSSVAPTYNFWAPYKGNDRYAYLGGTSMAAPLVSGCAALVRQYYASLPHEPSAALVKATLINGTKWLTGGDAVAERELPPNNHQGFGRVSVRTSLPDPAEPRMKLAFIDSWKEPALQLPVSNKRFCFGVTVGAGLPLRICLAYTDLPASGLQNILRLMVEAPDGRKFLGNGWLSPRGVPVPDDDNNVSIVRLEAPVAGQYLVQVTAWNILEGPQDYALVVTGALESMLARA